MEHVGHALLIWPDAPYLDTVRRICRTSFCKGWSVDGERIISARQNEVTDDLLVTINDEIAPELFGLFVPGNEFSG